MINRNTLFGAAWLMAAASMASAGGWTLDGGSSKIAYGSIKSNEVGEVNVFSDLTGTVSEDGAVELAIGLASVETGVDIRNERMIEHVFKNTAKALVTADLDMAKMIAMGVGEVGSMRVEGNLSLVGVELPIEADMTVARLADDKVLVTTSDMILLHTYDADLDGGIDTLQELAGLDIITRVAPVTMTLVFEADTPES